MQRVFQTFADRIAESSEPEAFRVAMADTAAAMELPCFAYLQLPRGGRSLAALISTYPTPWTDHYLREHYERLDPVILSAHARSEPFHWGQGSGDIATTRRQEQFFDEASAFGINCGFTIPIHDGRGPLAAVTFACKLWNNTPKPFDSLCFGATHPKPHAADKTFSPKFHPAAGARTGGKIFVFSLLSSV